AAVTRVPAEETVPARRHELGEVVLAEVDVVVGRDQRSGRLLTGWPVIDALARPPAGAGPRHVRRLEGDELALDAHRWSFLSSVWSIGDLWRTPIDQTRMLGTGAVGTVICRSRRVGRRAACGGPTR